MSRRKTRGSKISTSPGWSTTRSYGKFNESGKRPHEEFGMSSLKECKDLRTFLSQVEREHPEELVRIERDLELRFELSALLVKLDREHKFPIVLFENLRNVSGSKSKFPLLSNLFASRRLCALALESSIEKVGTDYDVRSQNIIRPAIMPIQDAPVKQVVQRGGDINLFDFPVPIPYHMEGGRTILGSVVTTVDNQGSHVYNCAYQTMRVLDNKRVTVGLGEGTHNWARFKERVDAGGDSLPIVAWIGHHPAACMGALTRVSIDVDEYSVIGGLLGQPLRVTPSETWGEKFLVPADAEIVIEGTLSAKETGRHGLRADFARYYSPETFRPILTVHAITHRRDA